MPYNNVFSIPVSHKHQTSMRRRFIVFSSVLFLLIFIFGTAAFIILMEKIQYRNAGHELVQTIEIERLKIEASINSEIAIALKMADSHLIRQYFLNPTDAKLRESAFEEIAGYRRAFTENNVFWINDIDKNYYFGDEYIYTLDTAEESSFWYNDIMKKSDAYSLMVNFDIGIKKIMLWIDAPVFNNKHEPIGIVGTGVSLSDFVNIIYQNYRKTAELYFFNELGEVTGTNDIGIIEHKTKVTEVTGLTGGEILAMSKKIRSGEIKYFRTKDNKQVIAVGSIPDLNWYAAAVRSFSVIDSLQTGMTALFGVMMMVIFSVFVIFNIFIVEMLEPLNRMVKTVTQTLSDWELKSYEENYQHDEIGTLGEFLNMTIIDQLTGIYNRRYLDGHLKKTIKHLARNITYLSLLMIDIDFFKKYNDTYGHDAGDNCLRAIASSLSQCITRDDDFIARYGGEEFVVVLPNTDKNGAQVVAEKMLERIRECNIPHNASETANHVTVSIGGTTGIVKYFHNGSDYIKYADKALYESKNSGRNRYTFENFEDSEVSFSRNT